MSEKQWPEHISKRKRQEIAAHILLRHAVKPHQDEGVSEKDRVVEKGLSGHKHKAEKRTAKENHDKSQGRADCKRAAPAQPDRNVAGVEQNECRSCAYGSADPV